MKKMIALKFLAGFASVAIIVTGVAASVTIRSNRNADVISVAAEKEIQEAEPIADIVVSDHENVTAKADTVENTVAEASKGISSATGDAVNSNTITITERNAVSDAASGSVGNNEQAAVVKAAAKETGNGLKAEKETAAERTASDQAAAANQAAVPTAADQAAAQPAANQAAAQPTADQAAAAQPTADRAAADQAATQAGAEGIAAEADTWEIAVDYVEKERLGAVEICSSTVVIPEKQLVIKKIIHWSCYCGADFTDKGAFIQHAAEGTKRGEIHSWHNWAEEVEVWE